MVISTFTWESACSVLGKIWRFRNVVDNPLIFSKDTLFFVFYGTHKEVQGFVKKQK